MRDDDFRRIALGMAGAMEGAHMGHPDFRVKNRIFATLHHDRAFGMVNRVHPDAFSTESGAVRAERIVGGRNLWLPILAHGFSNTIGLGLVYFGIAPI